MLVMPMPPGRLNRGQYASLARQIKVDPQNPEGCWIWKGSTTPNGYGKVNFGGKDRVVHRVMYEHLNGLIPEGMQGGHACHDRAVEAGTCEGGDTCRHRRCCNPAHQTIQTPSENTKAQNHFARNKTECPRGHEYTEENTRIGKTDGKRYCRACDRERKAGAQAGS